MRELHHQCRGYAQEKEIYNVYFGYGYPQSHSALTCLRNDGSLGWVVCPIAMTDDDDNDDDGGQQLNWIASHYLLSRV